jgi:peptidoglycan/LPS O-acetylase OafA/YrhL
MKFNGAPAFVKSLVGGASLILLMLASNLTVVAPSYGLSIYFATQCCCLLIVFLATRTAGFFQLGILSRSLNQLGKISFSFYLCHETMIAFSMKLFVHFGYYPGMLHFLVYFCATFGMAVALATASYVLVEKPLMDIGHIKAKAMLGKVGNDAALPA